nr:uncharacterized protein LOC112026382 [Quercus suber]
MSDLKALLKTRGKKAEPKGTGTSRPVVNLPPPPPQVPDPSVKPIPDLKKNGPLEPEEREVVVPPKTTKQQKVVRDNMSKRASSVESWEEPPVVDVRRGQRTWSPKLELDSVPFSWETSVRNYDRGRAGLIAEALELPSKSSWPKSGTEKPMLKPKRSPTLGSRQKKLWAETQRKLLNETQNNLASEKALVKELRTELQKAREAAKQAQRDAQLAKEATEAEKKAAFKLGVDVTEKGLTEQFASVSRDYCDITWGKALDAAGVPTNSELRLPGNVYYDPDIRELPESDPPPPEQLSKASERPLVSQVPLTTLEVSKESGQPGAQSKPAEPSKDKGKNSKKERTSSEPKDQVSTAAVTQSSKADDPVIPQTKS